MSKDIHPHSPVLIRFQQDLKLKGLSSEHNSLASEPFANSPSISTVNLNRLPKRMFETIFLPLPPSLIDLES